MGAGGVQSCSSCPRRCSPIPTERRSLARSRPGARFAGGVTTAFVTLDHGQYRRDRHAVDDLLPAKRGRGQGADDGRSAAGPDGHRDRRVASPPSRPSPLWSPPRRCSPNNVDVSKFVSGADFADGAAAAARLRRRDVVRARHPRGGGGGGDDDLDKLGLRARRDRPLPAQPEPRFLVKAGCSMAWRSLSTLVAAWNRADSRRARCWL